MAFFQLPDGMVGTDAIAKQRRFDTSARFFWNMTIWSPDNILGNGVWKFDGYLEKGAMGGVAYIELCQSNGRVSHCIIPRNVRFRSLKHTFGVDGLCHLQNRNQPSSWG